MLVAWLCNWYDAFEFDIALTYAACNQIECLMYSVYKCIFGCMLYIAQSIAVV